MPTPLTDRPACGVRRVRALVNPASGGVGPHAAEELRGLLAGLGLEHQVAGLVPGRFEAAVRAAIAARPEVVVVLGGDGTARLVAEMCGPDGPLVAPLPAGTMSKLGRALYGVRPWPESLTEALNGGAARCMPGGDVGGRTFCCSAVLGAPALWARAREAIRSHELGRAWRRALIAMRAASPARLNYDLDGERGGSLVVALLSPTVSRALSDDQANLEAAVFDLLDARAGLRLALRNLFGNWRDDPDLILRPSVSGRVTASAPIPVMLDGEFFQMGRQVDIRFRACAFRALAPAGGPEDA